MQQSFDYSQIDVIVVFLRVSTKSSMSAALRLLRYWPDAAFVRRGLIYALAFLALAGMSLVTGDNGYLWSATASIWTCLADRPGTAAARMRVLGAVGIGGGLACAIGSAASTAPWLALPIVIAGGIGAGLAEVRGPAAALSCKLLYVVLIAACLQPAAIDVPVLAHAVATSLDYLRGGLFACLVCLVLLPSQRDTRPRADIIAVYEALSRFAHAVAADAFPDDTMPYKQDIRRRIEGARGAVLARRGWRDPIGLMRYAYTVAVADAIFALLIVAAELRERQLRERQVQASLAPSVQQDLPLSYAARCLTEIEQLVREALSHHAPDLPALCAILAQELRRLVAQRANAAAPPTYQSALAALARFPVFADWKESFAWPRRGLHHGIDRLGHWLAEVAARDAQVTRHGLRLAMAGALSLLPSLIWRLDHGYWVAVTVIMVLSPRLQTTRQISFKRFAGSLAGALAACVISFAHPSPALALCISAIFLAAAYAGRLAGNAGLFAFCLTPAVILFSWTGEPAASSSHVAALRGIDTAIGCLIALASYFVLAPRAELSRAFRHGVDALAVNAVYLRAAIGAARTAAPTHARLEALRVAAGRASTRAEDTLAQSAEDLGSDLPAAYRRVHATARRMAALAGVVRACEADVAPSEAVQQWLEAVEARLAELAVRPGVHGHDGGDGGGAMAVERRRMSEVSALDASPGDAFLLEQTRFVLDSLDAAHAAMHSVREAAAALDRPLRNTAIS